MAEESGGFESLKHSDYNYVVSWFLGKFCRYDALAKVLSCLICRDYHILVESDWRTSFSEHMGKHVTDLQNRFRIADDGGQNRTIPFASHESEVVSASRLIDVSRGSCTGSWTSSEQSASGSNRPDEGTSAAGSAAGAGAGQQLHQQHAGATAAASGGAPAVGGDAAGSPLTPTAAGEMTCEDLKNYDNRRSTFFDRDLGQVMAHRGFYLVSHDVMICHNCGGVIVSNLVELPSLQECHTAHASNCRQRGLGDDYVPFSSQQVSQDG